MTALVNISADNVHAIKEGLNDLGNALLSINAIAGDDTTSRLIIDGGGILKVQGNTDTVFEGSVGIGVSAVTDKKLETAFLLLDFTIKVTLCGMMHLHPVVI